MFVQYMDMTLIIFADLDIAHCVYMCVCLHKNVTNILANTSFQICGQYLPIYFANIAKMRTEGETSAAVRSLKIQLVERVSVKQFASVEGWAHACRSPMLSGPHFCMRSRNAPLLVFICMGFEMMLYFLLFCLLPLRCRSRSILPSPSVYFINVLFI